MFHKGIFNQIVSLEHLFTSWARFRKGKSRKPDVQLFEHCLEDNIFQLHTDLMNGAYEPQPHKQFQITDPKSRVISKPTVRDRVLHQAIYQALYPAFDKTFIFDSYSCRNNKGTHRSFERLVKITQGLRNQGGQCWAIKLDVRKFFDSVDHEILLCLLGERIEDERLLKLVEVIIRHFSTQPGKGMPLGNLTSQLFANIYMDPLDKFVKHQMKVKHYIRYADDFTILSADPHYLLSCLVEINRFLKDKLKLQIHPGKVVLRKLSQGIDFVGYVALSRYCLPRHKTVKRMLKNLKAAEACEIEKSLPSYLGHLQHADTYRLVKEVEGIAPRI